MNFNELNNKYYDDLQGIYLDGAATTFLSERIFFDKNEIITAFYYMMNPSSLYNLGTKSREFLSRAREILALTINSYDPDSIIFTSGGTESNNLALRGIVPYLVAKNKTTIITSPIEHHSVLKTLESLEFEGIRTIYVPIDKSGVVDVGGLERLMKEHKKDLGLVSIMAVNNEIGTIQPLEQIGKLCRKYRTLFHTDAVQALGHIPLDVEKFNIDFMSMSGHKISAPKGIGALYVRDKKLLTPCITGGGQEFGLRSGTENVFGSLFMAYAAQNMNMNLANTMIEIRKMRNLFLEELKNNGAEFELNVSHLNSTVPHIMSIQFPGCHSTTLIAILNHHKVYVSGGSACVSSSTQASHVLKAIGLSNEEAATTIRISLDVNHITQTELLEAARIIASITKDLRTLK